MVREIINRFASDVTKRIVTSKMTQRVLKKVIANQTWIERSFTYPAQGMTPEYLTSYLREADAGNIIRQSELFEEMEEKDLHLASVYQTRKLAVLGLEEEVIPASDRKRDVEVAESVSAMLKNIKNWSNSKRDMLDAIGKGFSCSEIIWDVSEGQIWIDRLNFIMQKRFTFIAPGGGLLTEPSLLTEDNMSYGIPLVQNKFVYFPYTAKSGFTMRGGIFRPCSWMYLFKNQSIKNWNIFNELYSVPMRIGKYQSGSTPEDRAALKEAVWELGIDAAAILPDSALIEIIESKNKNDSGSFENLVNFVDKSYSKIMLGHTGSAESTAGKLGNENEAREVRQDILESDAKAFSGVTVEQIVKPYVMFQFGDVPIPRYKLKYEKAEDLEKTARVYGVLVRDVGFKDISKNHIHERFNIPAPLEGDELIESQQQQQPLIPEINKQILLSMINRISIKEFESNADDLENLANVGASEVIMRPMIQPVLTAIANAKDFGDLRSKLTKLYDKMDDSDLVEKIERARFYAQIAGRVDEKS